MLTSRGPRPQGVRWRPDESDQIAIKFTQYFLHRRTRGDRKRITDEWIQRALDAPLHVEIQSDGRYRQWVWIAEERKYLRIVLLEDRQTVHNAFFDRSFKESKG
jgi:predicted ATPase